MITAKALIAISLTALGGATTGAAIYMQRHPPVPASAPMVPPLTRESAPVRPPVHLALPEPEARAPVQVEPVHINAPLTTKKASVPSRKKRAPLAAPAPESATIVCSDWRSLESGPEKARVRMLCTPASGDR